LKSSFNEGLSGKFKLFSKIFLIITKVILPLL